MGNLIQGTKIGSAKSRASPRNLFYDSARVYVTLLCGLHHLFHGLSCKVIVHSDLLSSLAFVLSMSAFLPTLSTLFFNQVHYRVIRVLIVCCSNGVVAMNIYPPHIPQQHFMGKQETGSEVIATRITQEDNKQLAPCVTILNDTTWKPIVQCIYVYNEAIETKGRSVQER